MPSFASLILSNHLPNLCSFPVPTAKNFVFLLTPSVEEENAIELTQPGQGTLKTSVRDLNLSPHFQNLKCPSEEPDATKSVFVQAATDDIHRGISVTSDPSELVIVKPCGFSLDTKGFLRFTFQTHSKPSSPPDRKFSSLINLTQSIFPL
jgi:hypothetical protein